MAGSRSPAAPIYGNFEDYFPQFKQMLAEAGRSLADVPISMFGAARRLRPVDALQGTGRGAGRRRLAPEGADKIVPLLDKWAELIRKVNG